MFWAALAGWLAVAALCTLALALARERLGSAHMALAYLLVVLLGSSRHGRVVGLVLSVACFLAFNFFLLPPYYTLALREPLDLWVLVAFLVTGAVAAQLLHRAQDALRVAETRGRELDQMAATDRVRDAVLASVSHDLRTPLTSIQALASELRVTGDERALIIEEEAVRLNRMVTDLLDLSRVRLGSLPLELQIVAAEDVVGAALQRIGTVGGSDRIDVRLPADGSLPVGRLDFTHTLRVLVNLMENALRHSPPDERIEVDVEQHGDDLVVRVMDRGTGIPEADRGRLFEPFFNGPGPSGGSTRTGLGLSIAKSLARAQGGTVEYAARPGGGSVFELRLPAESLPTALR